MSSIKIEKKDRLSKRLDLRIEIKNNNCDQVFIKNYWIHNLYKVIVERPKVNIVEKIKKIRDKYKEIVRVVEEIKKAGVKNLRKDKWKIEEGLVLKEEKIYILKNKELRVKIIQLYHDMLVARYRER